MKCMKFVYEIFIHKYAFYTYLYYCGCHDLEKKANHRDAYMQRGAMWRPRWSPDEIEDLIDTYIHIYTYVRTYTHTHIHASYIHT